METDELKLLLAFESQWTVSINGLEYLPLSPSEIHIEGSIIRLGRAARKIMNIEWLRPNVVRIHARARFKTRPDVLILFPGDRLPSSAELQRRRRRFQNEIAQALCVHFGVRTIRKQPLHSDRQHGISGAYPRFLIGNEAAIAVDPEETSAVINSIMRAALLWRPLVRRRISVIVPQGRHGTIASRLRVAPRLHENLRWLQWNGTSIDPIDQNAEVETRVLEYGVPPVEAEVRRICSFAPGVLQATPHIAGRAISIRLRGIEVAHVAESGTTYPLGEPLDNVIRQLELARRHGSHHPLARAHEESWLESNLVDNIGLILPSIDRRYIYPQVPSFVGEERSIIDLLSVTNQGRLVVIEIKAAADPNLPFQALDYWIAVERHRKMKDFQRKGYFNGLSLQDAPAILVLAAPLLAFHKTSARFMPVLPEDIPLLEIGIGQNWKREIKILRRRGLVS